MCYLGKWKIKSTIEGNKKQKSVNRVKKVQRSKVCEIV